LIQVYTGEGKGKTTAALGLALRACGAGLKVYIAQFAKGRDSSELQALSRLENITCERFGKSCFIKEITDEDRKLAHAGFQRVCAILREKTYDMVILDEINILMHLHLIPQEETLRIIKEASKETEIVLTGRHAPKELIDAADRISKVTCVKHYYSKGVKARKGIEE